MSSLADDTAKLNACLGVKPTSGTCTFTTGGTACVATAGCDTYSVLQANIGTCTTLKNATGKYCMSPSTGDECGSFATCEDITTPT